MKGGQDASMVDALGRERPSIKENSISHMVSQERFNLRDDSLKISPVK